MKMNPLVPLGTFLSSRLPLTAFFHCKAIRYNRAFCNVGAPPGWNDVKLIFFIVDHQMTSFTYYPGLSTKGLIY